MFNYGHNKKMQKRPDNEPKFSLSNKYDKKIFLAIIISLSIIAILIALFVVLYYVK